MSDENVGLDGERIVRDTLLVGHPLADSPAYPSARVTARETATKRRADRLAGILARAAELAPAPEDGGSRPTARGEVGPTLAERCADLAELALLAYRA